MIIGINLSSCFWGPLVRKGRWKNEKKKFLNLTTWLHAFISEQGSLSFRHDDFFIHLLHISIFFARSPCIIIKISKKRLAIRMKLWKNKKYVKMKETFKENTKSTIKQKIIWAVLRVLPTKIIWILFWTHA